MQGFTNMELKNMVIEDVTGCSEHAKGRIGRVLQAIRLQDGEAFMMYPKRTDGKQPFFSSDGRESQKKMVFRQGGDRQQYGDLYRPTGIRTGTAVHSKTGIRKGNQRVRTCIRTGRPLHGTGTGLCTGWTVKHRTVRRKKTMIKIMDECCDCANGAYPCLGESCEKRHVKHLICDQCNADAETLYNVEGKQLCKSCLEAQFGTVEVPVLTIN